MLSDPGTASMWVFLGIALVTLIAAIAAITLRNLVHCGLCLAVVLGALAALYLQLDAQFVGLAQVLVYIGAVAVLILFTVLLTRGQEPEGSPIFSSGSWAGVITGAAVFAVLVVAIVGSAGPADRQSAGRPADASRHEVSVRHIGESLMGRFVLPLQVTGLLLTAALIGAVVIALPRRNDEAEIKSPERSKE